MTFIKKYHFIIFFSAWTLLNFFQAANTVLLNDETYYWVYSNFLDWGYFDHPPMIAILIKAGFFLFQNELGVRLFIVLLNTLTLLIIYRLLPRKNDLLFYAIACSIALLQLGGFIAVPDIPLIFFVALFFLIYKHFLETASLKNTILLGVVMSLMLYSKYHSVLIIIFTLISNPALLTKTRAYMAVLIAIVLFTPHLVWQYQHGFPSVQYHLFERNESSYDISYTLVYLAGQILLAGPLMGWLFLWSAFKYKPPDLFQRTLQYCFAGIYIFFLLTTYKGRVEANWTVPALVPLIILAHQYIDDKKKWQRILYYSVPLSLLLIISVRIYLMSDSKPIKAINTNEFEQNETWASQIKKVSGELPVVFINSYQKASKYWFYSGIKAFSLSTPNYRKNNYNFWPIEKFLQGKPVYAISTYDPGFFTDSITTTAGTLWGKRIDSFFSYSGLQFKLNGKIRVDQQKNIVADISINDGSQTGWSPDLRKFGILSLQIFQKDQLIKSFDLFTIHIDNMQKTFSVKTFSPALLPQGKYLARLSISSAIPDFPSLNSTNLELVIK
ncbi:MAG: glycosyltransferase family 39 protein [Chitinophagaceae bacterium]|nr:glycosyltransferase family 39 protein [Chitinophagaceae bacterium]